MYRVRLRSLCLKERRVTTSGLKHSDWKLYLNSNISNYMKICCSIQYLWPSVCGLYFILDMQSCQKTLDERELMP
jgi:hypothetical protein